MVKQIKALMAYLLSVYGVAILLFSFSRLVLFLVMSGSVEKTDSFSHNVLPAFGMGLRFDTVISCYILILPAFILFISQCFPFNRRLLYKWTHVFICALFSVAIFISGANIPYFQQFFKNLNASIWNWFDEPSFVVKMVLGEPVFLLYGVFTVSFLVAFCWVLTKIRKRFLDPVATERISGWKHVMGMSLLSLLVLTVMFMGVRGHASLKSPIRIGTAYFCGDPFLNQLGLNPVFVLIKTSMNARSEADRSIHMMDEKMAVENVRRYLHIEDESELSPIARMQKGDSVPGRRNVVVILMESMAHHYVADTALTPFLNQLAKKSIYFPNTYSAGIHTMNGVFGTLFGYPALMNQHPFKTGDVLQYESWPTVMKELGYETRYFTTHDEQFDNIGGYMYANDVDVVISEKDYPSREVRSTLGVCDDYMFRFAIPKLTSISESGSLFFATFLTASNHAPHIIPEYFQPRQTKTFYQVIEYSDYSLKVFFEKASQEPWFKNTLFVLLGDHGASNGDYDISLTYHHIPLVFYDPNDERGELHEELAEQIDVFPTTMGFLGLPYVNNTFGVDLMREPREQVFFSSDDAFCYLDSVNYFVHRNDGGESLYRYKLDDKVNYLSDEGVSKIDSMRTFTMSMIQSAQYMINSMLCLSSKSR